MSWLKGIYTINMFCFVLFLPSHPALYHLVVICFGTGAMPNGGPCNLRGHTGNGAGLAREVQFGLATRGSGAVASDVAYRPLY